MSENKLVSIEQLFSIAQQNTFSIQGLSNLLNSHESRLAKIETAQAEHENRITTFEENERIDGVDARRLNRAVHARCDYLLGIKKENGLVTKECLAKDKKYSASFRRRCYVDAKAHSRMANDYRETKKRDLNEVMEYIENWQPEVGYEGLTGAKAYIRYLDDRACV